MPLIKNANIASEEESFFTDDKIRYIDEIDEDKDPEKQNESKPRAKSSEEINIEAFKLATQVAKLVDQPDIVEIAKTISDFIRNYGKTGGNSI